MKALVLSLVLTAGGIAVSPSVFDSSEMGSASIYTAVTTCVGQQGGPTPEAIARCGCVVDAMRVNFKRTKQSAVTPEQATKCIEAPSPKGKTGR